MNYQEKNVTGKSWKHCHSVLVNNDFGVPPMFTFHEKLLTQLDDQVIQEPTGCVSGFFDPVGVIQLRNPETGELTGEIMTQADMYTALWSLYIALAEARDAEVVSE